MDLDVKLLDIGAALFAIPLASQSFLGAALFAGLQVEGVTLDLFDNIFLLNFALKATKRAFESFAILQYDFCQLNPPPLWHV